MATKKLIDSFTGELTSYSTTTVNAKGQPITAADVDGVIYRKIGSLYYKRNYTGPASVAWWGIKKSLNTADGAANHASFQAALSASKTLGGISLFLPEGDYIMDVSVPLHIPSNTTLIGIPEKSVVHADPATIHPMEDRPWPLTTEGVFFGSNDGNQPLFQNGTNVENIIFDGISITCNYTEASLAPTTHLKGIVVRDCNNVRVTNCNITNMPNTGISIANCHNFIINSNRTIRCGFGQAPGTNAGKNGISTSGYSDPTDFQERRSGIIEGNITNYNSDEGIQYAFVRGVVIQNNVCIGNEDRGIEGDNAYNTTATEASAGLEIPSQAVVTGNYIDGIKLDGTPGGGGISFSGGNEGVVILSNNVIKNCVGVGAIAVNQNNGGTCLIDSNLIDKCDPGQSKHVITTTVDDITITNNKITRGGSSYQYSDIFIYQRAKRINIINNISDGSTGNFLQTLIQDATAANLLEYINVSGNASAGAAKGHIGIVVSTNQTAGTRIFIKDNKFYNANPDGVTNNFPISIRNTGTGTSFLIDSIDILNNSLTFAGATTYAVYTTGFTAGDIAAMKIDGNDFFGLTMPSGNASCSSTTRAQVNPEHFQDTNNNIPSQRIISARAIPTTGTYTKGDKVILDGDLIYDNIGYICSVSGTPGTWIPFGLTQSAIDSFATTADMTTAINSATFLKPEIVALSGSSTLADIVSALKHNNGA